MDCAYRTAALLLLLLLLLLMLLLLLTAWAMAFALATRRAPVLPTATTFRISRPNDA